MIAKLRLYRPLNGVDAGAENDFVELGDHHTGAELAQIPTGLPGWAGGVLFREIGEIRAADNLVLERLTLLFSVN